MEFMEFSGKTVDEALTAACEHFCATSDKVEYEVVEEGASGFLGIGAKQATIKARVSMIADKFKPKKKGKSKTGKEAA